MNCKEPESMDELVYFTRRTLVPKGRVMAWASKVECPKCKKSLMGKPVEKGKVRIRASEYECPGCGFTEPKAQHEQRLTVCAQYECPKCGNKGMAQTPYKRKTWQGVPAFLIECSSCHEKIGITKKMKDPKKKGRADLDDDD